jgi:hypothetical protein
MKTDQFVELLSGDAAPPRTLQSDLILAGAGGAAIAAALFFAAIGFRPDIAEASGSPRFLFKFVITLSLAITACVAVARFGRPDGQMMRKALPLVIAPALLVCSALVELFALPEGRWMPHLVGHNARFCLTLIPLLAIGPLTCFLAALRHGAPSNPGLAGAVAGLAASGIAATFYAANCNDDSPLFVVVWYPMAITLVSLAGYLIGRRILRW